MKPRGTILIIGGAEDKGKGDIDMEGQSKEFERFQILKDLLPKNRSRKRIEIITTAAGDPKSMHRMYRSAFKKINDCNIGFIDISDKEGGRSEKNCDRVKKAHAVFFIGGDQFRLSTLIGGTPIISVIKEKYIKDENFIVAGTSAGAMAMSKLMIFEGGVHEAIVKDDIKMTSGMGIFPTCIIDTHFIKRGRFGRLAHAVMMNPESLGIGLGEDTALIIKKGNEAECEGSGMVVIIDGNNIGKSNITEAENDEPVYVEDLKVHLLVKGIKFFINERKMYVPARKKK